MGRPVNVGIFGGTFDPIHLGHLMAAEHARERLGLEEVLFLPTGQPYLKMDRPITAGHHRMAMVELAVGTNPYFRASDMEIKRPGLTYTIDTLVELRGELGPGVEIYVVLGLDSLREFHRWRQPRCILDMSTVVGVARPGSSTLGWRELDRACPGASSSIVLLDGPIIGVSGTELRRRVSKGLSIKYQVPEAVEAYVHEHGLYRG